MVGDDYDADILGAKNSGITPIFFNPKKLENPENFLEFNDYNQLIKIIETF
jgi:FMN phosphatase YigB (HAD superfamily)